MKKVGIVGCGSIAAVHASALRDLEGVHLCAFADCKIEKAEELAKVYGTESARAEELCAGEAGTEKACEKKPGAQVKKARAGVYDSLEKMLEQESLDAVHVCTPHYLHAPMACTLLEHDVSAFVEKPPAMTTDEFAALEKTAEKSKGRLGFCFQNRYNKTTRKIDALLQKKTLGELKGIRAFVTWRRPPEYYQESDWRGSWEKEGGGALINQSVHTLDLLLRWLGEPEYIEATMRNHHLKGVVEVEDTVEAFLTFPGGKRGCFYATTSYVADAPVIMELECERGRIFTEENRVVIMPGKAPAQDCNLGVETLPGKAYWGAGHTACIADFYRCMEENRPFENDIASVKNVMRTMAKIYESGREKL